MTVDPAPNPLPPSRTPRGPGERWERGHHFGRRHHRGHGIAPGLLLIALGGFLLLRELGLIDPTLRVLDFWPLVLVVMGLSFALGGRGPGGALGRRGPGGVLVGLAVALLGAGLLAARLGYAVPGVAHLWPLAIIAAGIGVIWSGWTRRRASRFANETVSADELRRTVTMCDLSLAVDSQQFRGGTLSATMGEVRVDLRRAALSGEEVVLDLSLTMGGIQLHVPSNWQVVNDLSLIMGVVEDKTDPRPDGDGVQRRLVLRGSITMGAVTIKN